jgi:uncharacterized protein YdhG (YjbR/CyaY superfamily)
MTIIDTYFKNSPESHKAEFDRVQKIVLKLVPSAEEALTYGVAGFKVNGHFFVGFGSNKNGVSLYPGSEPIQLLSDKLKDYKTTKGAIQYNPQNPLSEELVTEIIVLRRKRVLHI